MMNESIRRAVAYAAVGRANMRFGSSIYSYSAGHHTSMSKNFDHGCGSHLSGADNGNLYHYGEGAHINLKMNGTKFSGYDYSSGSHFSGQVRGRSVNLYDYGSGQHYDYSVS